LYKGQSSKHHMAWSVTNIDSGMFSTVPASSRESND